MRQIQRWRSMQKRGVLHTILCAGVERFGLDHATDWIVAMLHLAVAFFVAGLVIFLFPVNAVVAWVSFGLIVISGATYIALSTLPTVAPDCPYRTPNTPVSSIIWHLVRRLLPIPFWRFVIRVPLYLAHGLLLLPKYYPLPHDG
jgi:hypothetical protein